VARDKAARVARYLTGTTNITNITPEAGTRTINMGRTQYKVRFSTARSHNRTMEMLGSLRGEPSGTFAISTFGAETTEDFIVSMTLETFAPLLEAHYQSAVLPRLQRGE
jgi:hypothetical protein